MATSKEMTDFVIVGRETIGKHYFTLTLQHPRNLPPIQPGQFVEVEVRDCDDVMLRRPISIHDVDNERQRIDLLIQIVGKGTRKLSTLEVGERLNLIIPLGRGFAVEGKHPLLVGGGAGIAPLLHLAKCYNERGVRPTVLLGGRTAALIPRHEAFEAYADVLLTTDDGSMGEKGMVVSHSRFGEKYDHICTCGPTPMMKAVARHALQNSIPCEVSLENLMACGIGACLCCVVKSDQGHKCVCKEGPVFDARQLTQWIEN